MSFDLTNEESDFINLNNSIFNDFDDFNKEDLIDNNLINKNNNLIIKTPKTPVEIIPTALKALKTPVNKSFNDHKTNTKSIYLSKPLNIITNTPGNY